MPTAKNSTQKPKNSYWQLAKEIASLSTTRGRLVAFGVVILILSILPTDKLRYLPIKSVYESVFGWVPYSSGMTRGVSSILHGKIDNAWEFNPLSFLVLVVVLGIAISDLVKLKRRF